MDYLLWAGRMNQVSLLPFLAFLWTLWHIPNAPKRTVHGWTLYLLFIAVAIPAGLWCKGHYGTSMANIDWIHGPCEALLTMANMFIALGMRDAVRKARQTSAASQERALGVAVGVAQHALDPSSGTSRLSSASSATPGGSDNTTGQPLTSYSQQYKQQAHSTAADRHVTKAFQVGSATHKSALAMPGQGGVTPEMSEVAATDPPDAPELGSGSAGNSSGSSGSGRRARSSHVRKAALSSMQFDWMNSRGMQHVRRMPPGLQHSSNRIVLKCVVPSPKPAPAAQLSSLLL